MMRAGTVAVIALAVVLAACGDTAAPPEPAAEAAPAATAAPAPATATASPPPEPTPQPTATQAPQPAATPTPPPTPARAAAVDFSLPSAQGPQYTLSSFAGQQPVVVVFYRAFW